MGDSPDRRHSRPETPVVIDDPQRQAEAEAFNALRQFDTGRAIIRGFVPPDPERPFRLRPSIILSLHRVALEGLHQFAGNYRPGRVEIGDSQHVPPDVHLVPELVEDLCDYVNANWDKASAIHLAAYVMWRLNWIHPFADGNGRTSRIVSYVVLSIRFGYEIPGTNTIPDQIEADRIPYFDALEAADAAWKKAGVIDVSEMEAVLSNCLAAQFISAIRDAGGTVSDV